MEEYVAKATGSLSNTIRARNNEYHGFYRGTVVNNEDPKERGRCKIFVRGVYNEDFKEDSGNLLPWAEPCQPLFCGGMGDDGANGTFQCPDMNSTVWCFFENSDILKPVFFGQTTDANGKFSTKHCKMKWEKMHIDLCRDKSDGTNIISVSADTDITERAETHNKEEYAGNSITEYANYNIERFAYFDIIDEGVLNVTITAPTVNVVGKSLVNIAAPSIVLSGDTTLVGTCTVSGNTDVYAGEVTLNVTGKTDIRSDITRVYGDFGASCGVSGGLITGQTQATVQNGIVTAIS